MANEETKPSGEGETNPNPPVVTNPDEGRGNGEAVASPPIAEPSLQEQIDALKTQTADAVKGMGEAQRNAAQAVQDRDTAVGHAQRFQQMAQVAAGVAQSAVDPTQQAWAKIRAAREGYGEESDRAEESAFQELFGVQRQAIRTEVLQESVQAQQMISELPDAANMLQCTQQEAAQRLGALNLPVTIPLKQKALILLDQQGTAKDWFDRRDRAAEDRAAQATTLASLGQVDGARGTIGVNTTPRLEVDFTTQWCVGSKPYRDRLRAMDEEIVIVGAPEGFDPNHEPD